MSVAKIDARLQEAAKQTAAAPEDVALEARRKQHPAAAHIPPDDFKAWSAKGFPWRAVGSRIILMMMRGETRKSEGGIYLPDYRGSRGKEKELTTGLVVAHGAGELTPAGWISPQWDYDCTLGDIVFIEPNCGVVITDDDNEFRVITPHDLVMVLRRQGVGAKTRDKLVKTANQAIARYEKRVETVGLGSAPNPARLPERPSYEEDVGDMLERQREELGKATKTQVSMSGAHKEKS